MNNVNVKVNVKVEDVKEQNLKGLDAFNHLKHLQMLHESSDGWITLALYPIPFREPSQSAHFF